MFDERSSVGDAHTTEHSPSYGVLSGATMQALFVGGSLMAVTIAGMLVVADTELADWGMWLYQWPIVGVLVFGALLTAGRYVGLRGVGTDNYLLAVGGATLSVFAYSWFGGIVLTPFDPGLYQPALALTGAITIAITLVAAAYVYSTDRSLKQWATYSGFCFIAGLVAVVIGTFVPPVLILGFILFLLGFLCDLVYEIWMTSNEHRSPAANGLALYIAFAGVFVHVLQLVLRLLANSR